LLDPAPSLVAKQAIIHRGHLKKPNL
jgi:hypothetical protein